MDVLLKSVTGFACRDKTICIKQRGDNKTLYFQDNPAGVEMTFNVPAGKWTTQNKLRKLKKPLVYICPPLAEPELHRERKPFKFRVENNPNKVTISFAFKNFADIKCDPEIWAQSIPAFTFVMMHEHGHYYYGGKDKDKDPTGYYASETKCDIYACNKMLQNGFNPSQCIWGINLCLSDAGPAKERKQNVLDWVNKVRVEKPENMDLHGNKEKTVSKSSFVVDRDGEKIPLVQFSVSGDSDMVGKTYLLKEGSPIYQIIGNRLTEKKLVGAGTDTEAKIERVLAVESKLLHPSTWSQGDNIFLIFGGGTEYVHFNAPENWLGISHLLKHDVKKGIEVVKEKGNDFLILLVGLALLFAASKHE